MTEKRGKAVLQEKKRRKKEKEGRRKTEEGRRRRKKEKKKKKKKKIKEEEEKQRRRKAKKKRSGTTTNASSRSNIVRSHHLFLARMVEKPNTSSRHWQTRSALGALHHHNLAAGKDRAFPCSSILCARQSVVAQTFGTSRRNILAWVLLMNN